MDFRVGCCGFGIAKAKYFQRFDSVEVQTTFYDPPKDELLKKWKNEATADFEFAIKAWQLITHEGKSPTYRRLKRDFSQKQLDEAGGFKPTRTVREAWLETAKAADLLKASRILFQCPASFTPTERNIDNMSAFFSNIERPEGVLLFWEPRGAWDEKLLVDLCRSLNIFHAVDPFVRLSVTPEHVYYRMHGRTGWRYEYGEEELHVLKSLLPSNSKSQRVYFNNVTMVLDAARFQRLLSDGAAR